MFLRKRKKMCCLGIVKVEWPFEILEMENGILKGEECVLKSFGTKRKILVILENFGKVFGLKNRKLA